MTRKRHCSFTDILLTIIIQCLLKIFITSNSGSSLPLPHMPSWLTTEIHHLLSKQFMVSLRQVVNHVHVLVLKNITYIEARRNRSSNCITNTACSAAQNETRLFLIRNFSCVSNRSRQVVLILQNLTVLSYAY